MAQEDTPKPSGSASPKHQHADKSMTSSGHRKGEATSATTTADSNTLTKKKSLVPAVFQKTLQHPSLKKQSRQRQEGMLQIKIEGIGQFFC